MVTEERLAAYRALLRVEQEGGYSNIALRSVLRATPLDERQRAFCSALVYGALERQPAIDRALAPLLTRPMGKLDAQVRVILRLGAVQLLFLETSPAAAVSQSVEMCRAARKSSAAGMVNAVLRRLSRQNKDLSWVPVRSERERQALRLCVETELLEALRAWHGEAAVAFLEDALRPAPLFARVNTLRTDRERLEQGLQAQGVRTARPEGVPQALELLGSGDLEGLEAFRGGEFHIQDLSSQLCAQVLGARPGERVLDACAAPGGKSFTIAQEMNGGGQVVSCDIHPHRTALIESGARRLGLQNIFPMVQDATKYNKELKEFDRVLCDVPCSGLGGLRRRPELRAKPWVSPGELCALQYKILETSSQYVKAGGRLVYSTCTLNPAENEEVVRRFLESHPAFTPDECLPDGAWSRTLLPGGDWQGDGFYIAAMRRDAAMCRDAEKGEGSR